MACRSASRTQDAIESIKNQTERDDNVGELVFKHLELSFLASVRKCAKEILHTEKTIDILVNNAGESCCEYHNNIYYYNRNCNIFHKLLRFSLFHVRLTIIIILYFYPKIKSIRVLTICSQV